MKNNIYFQTEYGQLIHGDSRIVVNRFPENHFDAIVTDPPYGISFMGSRWDYDIPSVETFKKLLRVAKPGATLLCFAGCRTQHRMGVNIEDAGWILKDTLMYLFGSGFPKAADISKNIDKKACREQLAERLGRDPTKDEFDAEWKGFREVVGKRKHPTLKNIPRVKSNAFHVETLDSDENMESWNIDAPTTPEAELFQGYKSHSLKPAYEPIILAMKPNEGNYAENALKYGVSGINVDACRIKTDEKITNHSRSAESAISKGKYGDSSKQETHQTEGQKAGRFPSNVILSHHPECECVGTKKVKGTKPHPVYSKKEKYNGYGSITRKHGEVVNKYEDENGFEEIESWSCHPDCPVGILDEQSGERRRGKFTKTKRKRFDGWREMEGREDRPAQTEKIDNYGDPGNASRFFYTAKASKAERGKFNNHSTVKPKKLIEYLIKLVAPPTGGIILDAFGGSCTLGVACEELNAARGKNEPIRYVLIEQKEEYCEIGKKRIENVRAGQQFKLF